MRLTVFHMHGDQMSLYLPAITIKADSHNLNESLGSKQRPKFTVCRIGCAPVPAVRATRLRLSVRCSLCESGPHSTVMPHTSPPFKLFICEVGRQPCQVIFCLPSSLVFFGKANPADRVHVARRSSRGWAAVFSCSGVG